MSKEQYQDAIIQLLAAQRRPLPTRKIAIRTEMAWITTKKYLGELESSGKVTRIKKSNRVYWNLNSNPMVKHSMREIYNEEKNLKELI